MAKPEWGTKRQCNSCGARFYDLMKPEIACPKCGTVHDPDAATKSRRSRATTEKQAERQPVVVPVDRKSTRLNSSHVSESRMPSSA